MVKSKYMRMHLRGSMTMVDNTFQQTTIQVPIDADRNVGIVIREVNFEIEPVADTIAASLDARRVQVTNKSQSAMVGINDNSSIVLLGDVYCGAVAAGADMVPIVLSKELKPPHPVFNQEIYVGAQCDGAVTVNWDIIYDVAYFSPGEMQSLIKQHLL